MQDFVEEFIAKQRALLAESCAALDSDAALQAQKEREARLIRLGMCRHEYTDATNYDQNYPYQDYKTGKYYRVVPFTVTDEEYEAICLYDRRTSALAPKKGIAGRLFGNTAKRMRRLAFPFALGLLLISLALSAVLYVTEESFLFLSLGVAVAGIFLAFTLGLAFYAIGECLSRLDHISVEMNEKKKEEH